MKRGRRDTRIKFDVSKNGRELTIKMDQQMMEIYSIFNVIKLDYTILLI